eukprot:2707378-Pyramimonas_sp.AAC.1
MYGSLLGCMLPCVPDQGTSIGDRFWMDCQVYAKRQDLLQVRFVLTARLRGAPGPHNGPNFW